MAYRYLGETNIEVIESWTPHEFNLLIEGYNHKRIDEQELKAWNSMAIGYAINAGKKAKQKKIFDAEKARKRLENGFLNSETEIKKMVSLNQSVKGFDPAKYFKPKGGSA